MPVKQSVCIPILPPMYRDILCEAIADIGYPAIEIWGRSDDFDEVCRSAAQYGLKNVQAIPPTTKRRARRAAWQSGWTGMFSLANLAENSFGRHDDGPG